MNEQLNISLQVHFRKDLSDMETDFRLWSSLKKFYSRHHELVNGYRVSVTQIRTDPHLLLMSFPSSDATSTGLDYGQRSGCIAIGRNCWLLEHLNYPHFIGDLCSCFWFFFVVDVISVFVVCSRDFHVIGFTTFDWRFCYSHTYLEEPSLLVIKGISTWPLWSKAASLFLTLYTGGLYECLLEA